jgi:fluoroquinolone resistance protein
MQDVEFSGCKLLGVEFRNCNQFLFETSFNDCNLELVSFAGMKIKETVFQNSELKEVNFSGSDLTGVIF